jgi:hypothetical protein
MNVSAVVLMVAVATAASASAAGHPAPKFTPQSATIGLVRALDLSDITVGRTTCTFTGVKMEAATENFDLGENVAITCAGGVLKTITLAPDTGRAHAVPYLHSTVAYSQPSSSGSGSGLLGGTISSGLVGANASGRVLSFTSGEQVLGAGGGSAALAATGTQSATGPVTSITQVPILQSVTGTAITVGDATCTVMTFPNSPLSTLAIGTVISISCTGTLADGMSASARIELPPS